MRAVDLWTDGSGTSAVPGGFAYVLVDQATGTIREGHGGALVTTNNRMELTAVIKGLEALKRPCRVTVYSDSEYVGKAFPMGWVGNWKRKNWKGVKNPDLWQRLDQLVGVHDIKWNWVKGHSGAALNESCDKRAGACRKEIISALEQDGDTLRLQFEIVDQPAGKQLEMAAS